MPEPKQHHYVPQFYLSRWGDERGLVWVWDRDKDRVFQTTPRNIAGETRFYWIDDLERQGLDPLTMEKQFAAIEGEVKAVTSHWLETIPSMAPWQWVPVTEEERHVVALFIALQSLRTLDAREILLLFAEPSLPPDEQRRLHAAMLWESDVVEALADRVARAAWILARNATETPYITSDNPVAFRAGDNSMWLKARPFGEGTYVVYPLSPWVMLYCHPPEGQLKRLAAFNPDCCVSPVPLTDDLVINDNTAQVFMASRFVVSNRDNFDFERDFARTVGTDTYAAYWESRRQAAESAEHPD